MIWEIPFFLFDLLLFVLYMMARFLIFMFVPYGVCDKMAQATQHQWLRCLLVGEEEAGWMKHYEDRRL